jgi:hypothetical protein
VLHADHAVSTAGNTSRGLGSVVVHLGYKKNGYVEGEEKWKVIKDQRSLSNFFFSDYLPTRQA